MVSLTRISGGKKKNNMQTKPCKDTCYDDRATPTVLINWKLENRKFWLETEVIWSLASCTSLVASKKEVLPPQRQIVPCPKFR